MLPVKPGMMYKIHERILVFRLDFFPGTVTFLKTHQTLILQQKYLISIYFYFTWEGEFLFQTRKLAHNLCIVVSWSMPPHNVFN